MSLESWKAEFYPCEADAPPARRDPVAHSLRKWIGLRVANLEKHACWLDANGDVRDGIGFMEISADTCALCLIYLIDTPRNDEACVGCLLFKARRGRCDRAVNDEVTPPWTTYMETYSPEPMIHWLREALKLEQKGRVNDL